MAMDMKNLYESIMSKSGVGAIKINFDELKDVYVNNTLHRCMNIKSLYDDANKILKSEGKEQVRTHVEAFAVLFCDQPFKKKDFEAMTAGTSRANDDTDRILKERFKKYIKSGAKFHFYCAKSSWFPGYYDIGVLEQNKNLTQTEILTFKAPK